MSQAAQAATAPKVPAPAQQWPETRGEPVGDNTRPVPAAASFTPPAVVLPQPMSVPVVLPALGSVAVPGLALSVVGQALHAGQTVLVEVLPQSVGAVAGGSPLSFRLRAADGSALGFPVQVQIPYGTLARAMGANWADRVQLLVSASCVADAVPCQDSSAVLMPSTNDRAKRVLTVTVSPADAVAAEQARAAAQQASPAVSGDGQQPAPVGSPTPTATAGASPSPAASGTADPTVTPTADPSGTPAVFTAQAATADPSATATLDPSASPSATSSPAGPVSDGSSAPQTEGSTVPTGLDSGTVAGAPVYTMSASSSGASSGTFSATSLTASSTWTAGAGTGGFDWNYPIPVPPSVAGASPPVSLDYSSASVDGRSTAANTQPSWAGLGFELGSGYIERVYTPCAADNHSEEATWGDLCWKAPTGQAVGKGGYLLSLNGHSDELIETSTADVYRLEANPGWRIQHRTLGASANGDNDREYWVVTTNDGTRYWMGYGAEFTTNTADNATWTVPVYGNDPGEPCYLAAPVSQPGVCTQAWRWNLDRVVDTNNNAQSYFYSIETNNYGRGHLGTVVSNYVRAGYLAQINYGYLAGSESANPPAKVWFGSYLRCADGVVNSDPLNTANPTCPAPTPTSGSVYPDAPTDQICTSNVNCTDHYTPTFFQTKRLDAVITSVQTSAGGNNYAFVSKVAFKYLFPTNSDGTDPMLWLDFVQRRGLYGGSLTQPVVKFTGTEMNNRVDWNTGLGVPATVMRRVTDITNELGGDTIVSYGEPDACPQDGSAASGWSAWYANVNGHWDTNTYDCFPQNFDPDGPSGPIAAGFGIFHKYLVTSVLARDGAGSTGTAADMRTDYLYSGSPAWRKEEPLNYQATGLLWNDWRGYRTVDVRSGVVGASWASRTRHTFFRGMYGDALVGGGTKTDALTDYNGNLTNDWDYLAGQEQQSQTYDGTTELRSSRTAYWPSTPIDGPGRHDARMVRPQTISSRELISTGGWRTRDIVNSYDPSYGILTQHTDGGDGADPNDNRCTTLDYSNNASSRDNSATGTRWFLEAVQKVALRAGTCTDPTILRYTATFYDSATTFDSVLYRANPTLTRVYKDAGLQTYLDTGTGYDGYGRVTSSTPPRAGASATTISYNAPTGTTWPFNGITTSRPHAGASAFVQTVKPDPAYGTVSSTTDLNGNTTAAAYDELGRLLSTHGPLEEPGVNTSQYTYPAGVSSPVIWGSPNRVTSQQLYGTPSAYLTSYSYYDGWGRQRQTQTNSPSRPADGSPSRIVSFTDYDGRGLVSGSSGPLWNGQDGAGMSMLNPALLNITSYTATEYDALARPTKATLLSNGAEQWHTTSYYYGADKMVVIPPTGNTTKTSTDVWGQPTKTETIAGSLTATVDRTFNAAGDLTGLTQSANSGALPALGYTYTYDNAGRRTQSIDPDSNTTNTVYDDDGNITSTSGSSPATASTYDDLDRPVTLTSGPTSRTFSYDTVSPNGKGLLASASSTDTVNGQASTVTETNDTFDVRGRLTGKTFTIDGVGYPYTFGYDRADRPLRIGHPDLGVAGLGAETVTDTYDSVRMGALDSVSSSLHSGNLYNVDSYNGIGMLGVSTIGGITDANQSAGTNSRVYTYDTAIYKVKTLVGSLSSTGAKFLDNAYTYDELGNPTKILEKADSLPAGQGWVDQNECFRYDSFMRLARAWTTTDASCADVVGTNAGADRYLGYSRRYAYNLYNRITDSNGDGTVANSYAYDDSKRPHNAIAAITQTGAPTNVSTAYSYDAAGEQTQRTVGAVSKTLTWNGLHELTGLGPATVPATSTPASYDETYTYGPGGDRAVRRVGTSKTVYLPDAEITKVDGITTDAVRYYHGGAKTIGYAHWITGATSAPMTWLGATATGSMDISIDAGTGTVSKRRHLPYGETINPTATGFTTRGFLGKPEDSTGLDQLGARMYDPGAGNFLSPDPLSATGSGLSLSAFQYSGDNPVEFSDPTGLREKDAGCNEANKSCLSAADVETQERAYRVEIAVRATRDAADAQLEANKAPGLVSLDTLQVGGKGFANFSASFANSFGFMISPLVDVHIDTPYKDSIYSYSSLSGTVTAFAVQLVGGGAIAGAGRAAEGASAAERLFTSRAVGVDSKLLGNSYARGESGLLNRTGSRLKFGWTSSGEFGGGWHLRLGIGRSPLNPNQARFHWDFGSTHVPNSVANDLLDVLRGLNGL